MRYFSLQRPVDIGTTPSGTKIISVHNFDEKRFCKEIERKAWGYVDVEGEIPQKDCIQYDLAPDGEIPWIGYIWTEMFGKGLTIHEGFGGHILADRKERPEGMVKNKYGNEVQYDSNGHGVLVETVIGAICLEYFENEETADLFFEKRKAEIMGGAAA